MDFASLPSSYYLSTPTSPTGCIWSSPVHPFECYSGAEKINNDDGFEFEFDTSQWDDHKYRQPARANSFSAIAYADEVLPLKLPPRLQTSVPTSPRSLSSRVRSPFAQKCTWNDGFDPFMIALEKVSQEPEARVSVHRRSRSYSPFRARCISHRVGCTLDWDHGQEKEPTITEMMDRKGSMYSKWVRSQTMVKTPTARTMVKKLWLGHNEPVKPMKRNELTSCSRESKMHKVKSVLCRYASLKKETCESKQSRDIITRRSKISYFKRLSLSLKANWRNKESFEEAKMVIVKHDKKLPRCLGYAPVSPRWL